MLAPAKINLFLHITGKLHNGYHSLESLMIPIDVNDVVDVRRSSTLELEISGEFAKFSGAESDNIVLKAVHLLAVEAGIANPGAKITLQKNIPVGAGLGGGSADAAATLKLLNDLWGLNYSGEKLKKIGENLGADVPFCLENTPSFVCGFGENVKKAATPPLHILLVYPNKPLSTKNVFGYAPFEFAERMFPQDTSDFIGDLKKCANDLEANAISLLPEISEVLDALSEQGGCLLSRMSGSGSACFGLFDTNYSMERAADRLAKEKPKWWIKSAA